MTDDSGFPLRPDTPAFWKLCEIARQYDDRIDGAATPEAKEQVFQESLADLIDAESLAYFAVQRAMRISHVPSIISMIAASYVEGFVIGNRFSKRET